MIRDNEKAFSFCRGGEVQQLCLLGNLKFVRGFGLLNHVVAPVDFLMNLDISLRSLPKMDRTQTFSVPFFGLMKG